MKPQRIEYLDIAKGIGILLVVIGHSINSNNYIGKWIWTFHMPLFFIISGMLYDSARYPYFPPFLKKKTKALLFPLLIFSILVIILKTFFLPELFNISSLKKNLPDVAYWFILILYLSEIIYYFINKFINNIQTRLVVILLLPAISFILMKQSVNLPYNMSSVFICTFFYGIGNLFKYKINSKIEKSTSNYRNMFLSLILLFIPAISVYFTNRTIDLRTNTIPYPMVYHILIALIGVYGILLFSKIYFKNNSFIKNAILYIGENTLIILLLHMSFISLSSKYISPMITNSIIYKVVEQLILWLSLSISINLINRKIKWIIGK